MCSNEAGGFADLLKKQSHQTPMKFKTLLTLAAVLSLGFHVNAADEEDTPLAKEMSAMNKSYRTLKKQIGDASKKDDNIALLEGMKKGLDKAATLEPIKTKDVKPADKAAYLAKYKDELVALGKTYDEIEAAVKADKPDEAKKLFDKVSDQKEKGHKDFAPEDEK